MSNDKDNGKIIPLQRSREEEDPDYATELKELEKKKYPVANRACIALAAMAISTDCAGIVKALPREVIDYLLKNKFLTNDLSLTQQGKWECHFFLEHIDGFL